MKCRKIFLSVVLGLAVLMGILVLALPQEHLDILILVSRFFEAMIPILALGALIKYLFSCPSSCSSSGATKCSPCDDNSKGA